MSESSGNWWSSTQYSATNAVKLNNGGFNNNNKNNSNGVVPFLDYSAMAMKSPTYDFLIDRLYEAYYECRRKKRWKDSSVTFELDYEKNLRDLANDLLGGRYKVGTSIVFAVTRPKVREVFAADFRDRVVHHLVMREFGEIIDGEMIADSFSCRKGMGVQYGVDVLREQIIEVSDHYRVPAHTLSCDISGFFMSIDKGRCYDMIEATLREKCREREDLDWWLDIIRKIVMNRPELNCEVHGEKKLLDGLPDNKTLFRSNGRGFPIGNLTSQIFGNFYLTGFDKWSIAYLGDRGRYCRYVDDIRVTSRDRKLLMRYMHDARAWLTENLGITLHPKKWSLQDVHKGVPFIGSVIKPWGIYAGNRLVDNAFGVVRQSHRMSVAEYVARMNSYLGFLRHRLSYGIRWRLLKETPSDIRHMTVCCNLKKMRLKDKYRKLPEPPVAVDWLDFPPADED